MRVLFFTVATLFVAVGLQSKVLADVSNKGLICKRTPLSDEYIYDNHFGIWTNSDGSFLFFRTYLPIKWPQKNSFKFVDAFTERKTYFDAKAKIIEFGDIKTSYKGEKLRFKSFHIDRFSLNYIIDGKKWVNVS